SRHLRPQRADTATVKTRTPRPKSELHSRTVWRGIRVLTADDAMNGLRQKAIARRYARALLNVAMAEGADVDRIDRELTSAVNLTGQHPLLNRVLVSPVVSRDRKRAILDAISVRAGWSDLLRRFLGLLADRHRLGVLPEIIDCLRSELLARRGIVRAHVTTAMPLDAAQIEAIAKALSAVTRRDVELDAR